MNIRERENAIKLETFIFYYFIFFLHRDYIPYIVIISRKIKRPPSPLVVEYIYTLYGYIAPLSRHYIKIYTIFDKRRKKNTYQNETNSEEEKKLVCCVWSGFHVKVLIIQKKKLK